MFDQDRQSVDTYAEVDRIAMQIDFQLFVEPEHGNLPSIWTIVASSSRLAFPRSNSTPLGSRTCTAIAISNSGDRGGDGCCGADITGTNADGDSGEG
ncbi:hypothetical protein [Burkholderia gladioli]|uniref:hypothetical protein n=1 Tax=Burkholderia gladioli TaxID=28095 RepID=UPI00358F4F70